MASTADESQSAEDPESEAEPETAPIVEKRESKPIYKIVDDLSSKKVKYFIYHYENDVLRSVENITEGTSLVYDEQGRELGSMYTDSGEMFEEYRYDDQGSITYYKYRSVSYGDWLLVIDHQGSEAYRHMQKGEAEYEYDDSGKLISCRSLTDNYTLSFEYSDDGLHANVTKTNDDGTSLFSEVEYDGKGHIIRQVNHYSDHDITKTWTYDDNGRLIEETDAQNNRLETTTYEYDRNGDLILQTQTDKSGDADSYLFIYDENRNMLEWHLIHDLTASGGEKEEYRVQLNEYNEQNDIVRSFDYNMGSLESTEHYYKVSYYFYDYDDIDPLTDDSFLLPHN